jgi:hypothetical protein
MKFRIRIKRYNQAPTPAVWIDLPKLLEISFSGMPLLMRDRMRCSAADAVGRGSGSTSGGTSLATVPTGVVRACRTTSLISKFVSHTRCFSTSPTSAKLQPLTL